MTQGWAVAGSESATAALRLPCGLGGHEVLADEVGKHLLHLHALMLGAFADERHCFRIDLDAERLSAGFLRLNGHSFHHFFFLLFCADGGIAAASASITPHNSKIAVDSAMNPPIMR